MLVNLKSGFTMPNRKPAKKHSRERENNVRKIKVSRKRATFSAIATMFNLWNRIGCNLQENNTKRDLVTAIRVKLFNKSSLFSDQPRPRMRMAKC
ncbi:Hypothetical protein NTJ_05754 [Nesidiocoris tenuis]|uniref:Uncharacterized protein n=1 Tax=Nesidiocoris tenuis TaxID=355587 RepID=A0ABN7AL51_9HEMI|nr:Hypothetical protein NTJ_05754 [Nesidiocoris tenuis]